MITKDARVYQRLARMAAMYPGSGGGEGDLPGSCLGVGVLVLLALLLHEQASEVNNSFAGLG